MAGTALDTPPAITSTSFTRFPDLPTELRLKIWGFAWQAQRVVELQYCIVDRQFFSFQHLPAVLHTSRESREAGLQYYHLSFGTDRHPPGTYFNAANDIVYFGSRQYDDEIEYMLKYFRSHADSTDPQDQIQNLALAEYLWRYDYSG